MENNKYISQKEKAYKPQPGKGATLVLSGLMMLVSGCGDRERFILSGGRSHIGPEVGERMIETVEEAFSGEYSGGENTEYSEDPSRENP